MNVFTSEKTRHADVILQAFADKTFADMKAVTITHAMCDDAALTDRPRTKALPAHIDNLRHQFIGSSELCFYHAVLVVLLRRHYQPEQTFAAFESLWKTQSDYLLDTLSLRWLVSACDSFVDYSACPVRAATLMNVATLINTLKVYETQRYLYALPADAPLCPKRTASLYQTHLPLYEGLTLFRIGTDDTLKNMRQRYQRFQARDELAGRMLLGVFDRLHHADSAFVTMQSLHQDDKSAWWTTTP
ncbi:hypothetical protein GCM10009129_17240 [Psychrobacter aestuarii]|uniref:Uncharacterized protein n=2 Tax=Psychrobacter aestuarii TaxID=556327 RepID=A0ABN0VXY0_9GAMM